MALSGGGSQLPMPAIVTRYTDLLPFALARPQEPNNRLSLNLVYVANDFIAGNDHRKRVWLRVQAV